MTPISKSDAVDLLADFIKHELVNKAWYKDIQEFVYTILLYGSVAKGTNKKNSDIDMLIIVPLDVEEKYTAGEYLYIYKGFEINIVLRSIERLRNLARDRNDKFQIKIFRDIVIIQEKDEEVRKLIDQLIS